tara:strand:- start:981 stop:1379 length:399 start_codon:yes stop_codon:yes gene_type:complete
MPNTYTANEDGSYSVVSEDELSFANFTHEDPSTGEPWKNLAHVKKFVEDHPQVWTAYSSLPTKEEQDAMTASNNRMIRNQLLMESDWTQMPDGPLADEVKTSWATYRSSLRSLPEHENWPNLEDADWPTKPS